MDWENARRVREPVAWILLVITAIGLVIGAWTLFGLPGGPIRLPNGQLLASPGESFFHLRALSAVSDFVASPMTGLPVLAVVLVTLAGGLTERAGRVALTAVSLQCAALGLGLISFFGALGTGSSPGAWFYISEAGLLGLAAAGLILTGSMLRSSALRASG